MSRDPDCSITLPGPPPVRVASLGNEAHRLLDLPVHLGHLCYAANPLVDSGAIHNFIGEHAVIAAGLTIEVNAPILPVRLANGDVHQSKGTVTTTVAFSAHVMHTCTFHVVSLAMDCIQGMLWLRGTSPAIDWTTHRILWKHEGNVFWTFGRGATSGGVP